MRLLARAWFLVLAALAVGACGDRATQGAAESGRIALAIPYVAMGGTVAAQTPSQSGELSSIRVRITVVATGEVLLDNTVDADDRSVTRGGGTSYATMAVAFPLPAGGVDGVFSFELTGFSANGTQIIRVGPETFTLDRNGRAGTIEVDAEYVGPGATVTTVALSPRTITVIEGQTAPIACAGNPGGVSDFPYELSSANEGVARLPSVTLVQGVAVGTTQITCRLMFGTRATDVIPVTVLAAGTPGITLLAGGGQTGLAEAVLPVDIRVLVRGANGQVADGVQVQFQPTVGGGSANPATRTTAADGTATTSFRLGALLGTQTLTVSVPSLGYTLLVNATATATTGTISGVVRGANLSPLQNILVEVRAGTNVTTGPTAATSVTTGGAGTYQFANLAPGAYTVRASGAGFVDQAANVVVVIAQTTTHNITMVAAPTGSIAGTVRNAVDNTPRQGATVEVRAGTDVVSGATAGTATSTAAGTFNIGGLAPGAYTMRVVLAGFAEFRQNVTVVSSQVLNANVQLAPLDAGIRIVLTWGATPQDLDASVEWPSGLVFFGQSGNCVATPFACLENDETGGFGPETMRITQLDGTTYTYRVHDFSNFTGAFGGLSASGAVVQVYVNGVLQRTFNVPVGLGVLWTVFTISGNIANPTITAVGTISALPPPWLLSAPTGAGAGSGAAGGTWTKPPPSLRNR